MTVELREITSDDLDLRATLVGQTLRPEQHEFATIAAETLPLSDQDHDWLPVAVAATGAYVRQRLPGVTRVVLGANHRNPVAVAAYLRGGFVMTGQDYLGGLIGPQHVMELEV
jgi:hypothetical protein